MSHEIFSDPWAQAWAKELRTSQAYREAAATWEGSILLEILNQPQTSSRPARAVFVDLWHGECRDARGAKDEDHRRADYIIGADLETWKRVLASDLEPIFGLMSGKLKLSRGSLAKLTPHMAASRELVQAATRVDSAFPDE